ncbi:hypothetical protein [Arthrobacter flavus]|uniref:DUF805 domain-containing protein n=1 Tax=Arthrobacter flavus TaxID=95172 RepID=A0ABW4Q8J9_9MICC
MASVFFALLFAPTFAVSLSIALNHRGKARRIANWWPFAVLCAMNLAVIAMFFGGALADPDAYF